MLGCEPGAVVTVIASASHASGTVIGQTTSNVVGAFSVPVSVPYKGQPTATVSARCLDRSGATTIAAATISITYTNT